jgi:hypothetical protein
MISASFNDIGETFSSGEPGLADKLPAWRNAVC